MIATELELSERVCRLRSELFATKTRACPARAAIVTASYRESEGEPWVLRRARALDAVFRHMPLFIREGEMIVGQRAAILAGRSVYPEYFIDNEDRGALPDEVLSYWEGKTLGEETHDALPEAVLRAERELAAAYCTGTRTGFGHVIVGYEKALTRGFLAIAEEAERNAAQTPAGDREGEAFLQAVAITARGVVAWAERYADLAEQLAARETSERREELLEIAAVCRRVPAHPARSFHEALQSFWFTHLALHLEQYGWSISAGRFDQYMAPYYTRDLETGRLDQQDAWELLLGLWVKFMENVGAKLKKTTFQNLTLGGQDSEGKDQSNPLSHLCLDATVALRFNQPALSVRWHPGIDPAFWHHVHQTISHGLGMPALFNDGVIIRALTTHGVTPEDAVGYGIVGCVEACVPGRQQGVTAGGHLNVAKALELALNEGRSSLTSEPIGVATRAPETFTGFSDLWEAYTTQVRYLASLDMLAATVAGTVQKQRGHCPFMSSLLEDCLTRRRDLVHGATHYNLPGISVLGNSNVYDGLTAIRHLVCEQKRIGWGELRRALNADFQGFEELRRRLARGAPRFGNAIAEVDELANRVNAVHAEFCWAHTDARGGRFTCGVWPVEGHVHSGHRTGATPDGRHAGEPLADGVGACHGADRKGPTALLTSVAGLNHAEHWTAGNTCNIRFSAGAMTSFEAIEKLQALVTTYMKMGGQQLQINVLDADELRSAQENPVAHEDLIVRVAGFSAYFTQLDRDVQEEIISRTEQAM
jgi:formate C-acetyltransferase